ncbi:RES domain-containing protein [Fulvivirga ulvae]|uniref:RES domain-containing protein n=1 Tax=Fulvivirga ulvae TaxID=2904245 RepID=UPI001F3E7296|nr:RES domain-containing protein [Fulvivirga ulvae]UII32271.1 RES domain-containing protein [Fulvivirga ulvae]
MTFTQIIQDELTNLPLVRQKGHDFREFLFKKLEAFNTLVQESNNLSGTIDGIPFKEQLFKRRSNILVNGIKETVNKYYEGAPHKAYEILSKTLKLSAVMSYLDKEFNIPRLSSFFRIREVDNNYPLSSKEIFHIPFHMRERVATQRFSIPGLPTLYLSNSLFVAWEELGRPPAHFIQTARFVNGRQLRLLDLTNDIYQNGHLIKGNEAHGFQLLYFVMVWPLVAACSIKSPDRHVPFKAEYIIPQLLLQWINKNTLDGVKYSSTHINPLVHRHRGHLYNIAIPVKTHDQSVGYCEELLTLFKVTSVLPMHLTQFAAPYGRFSEQASASVEVNPDVYELELISDKKQNYSETAFGQMEHLLRDMKPYKLSGS